MDAGSAWYRARVFQPSMHGLKFYVLGALCLGAFITAGGCGGKDLSKPPKIGYGHDVCAQCRMIIQDERFACAVVSAEKRYLKFDDIGCLAEHEKKQAAGDLRSWVRDALGGGWVVKDEASFVYLRDLVTPMGYGFAAFSSAEGAERFVRENGGRVLDWDQLKTEEVK